MYSYELKAASSTQFLKQNFVHTFLSPYMSYIPSF